VPHVVHGNSSSLAAAALALAVLRQGERTTRRAIAKMRRGADADAAEEVEEDAADLRPAMALAQLIQSPLHKSPHSSSASLSQGLASLGASPTADAAAYLLRGVARNVVDALRRHALANMVEHVWLEREEAHGAVGFGGQRGSDDQLALYNEERAAAGDAASMFWVAQQVYFGRGGVERDLPRARSLFEGAAAAGSSEAMLNAGVMAMTGQGGGKDAVAAARWFEEAAGLKHNHSDALTMLGNMAFHGVQRPAPEPERQPQPQPAAVAAGATGTEITAAGNAQPQEPTPAASAGAGAAATPTSAATTADTSSAGGGSAAAAGAAGNATAPKPASKYVVPPNASRALSLWERAAKEGSDGARESLADVYIDPSTMLPGLLKSAALAAAGEAGEGAAAVEAWAEAEAERLAGGVAARSAKALRHLSNAAGMGSWKALWRLGLAYTTQEQHRKGRQRGADAAVDAQSFLDSHHRRWLRNATRPGGIGDDGAANGTVAEPPARRPSPYRASPAPPLPPPLTVTVEQGSEGELTRLVLPRRADSAAALPFLRELAEMGPAAHGALRPALTRYLDGDDDEGAYVLFERGAVLGLRVAAGNAAWLAARMARGWPADGPKMREDGVAAALWRRVLWHTRALAAAGRPASALQLALCHLRGGDLSREGRKGECGLRPQEANATTGHALLDAAVEGGSTAALLHLGWIEDQWIKPAAQATGVVGGKLARQPNATRAAELFEKALLQSRTHLDRTLAWLSLRANQLRDVRWLWRRDVHCTALLALAWMVFPMTRTLRMGLLTFFFLDQIFGIPTILTPVP